MNTGDSNYITPNWPHSFTNRDPDQEAYILAITFGGDVRRAQKELYALGDKSNSYVIEYRDHNKAIRQLIKQHMMNENMKIDHLISLAQYKSMEIDLKELMKKNEEIPTEDLRKIAVLLNVELDDELIAEGLARELVNKIQQQRKLANFNVSDRIRLSIQSTQIVQDAFDQYRSYVTSETLTSEVAFGDTFSDKSFVKQYSINGELTEIRIEQIAIG